MIKLTQQREIAPYKWVHPDDDERRWAPTIASAASWRVRLSWPWDNVACGVASKRAGHNDHRMTL
jgi:hypothetical protein